MPCAELLAQAGELAAHEQRNFDVIRMASSITDVETLLGRRVNIGAPWHLNMLARAYRQRGELRVARALARANLDKIEVEPGFLPIVLQSTQFEFFELAVAAQDAEEIEHWAGKIQQNTAAAQAPTASDFAVNRRVFAQVAMLHHDQVKAIDALHEALMSLQIRSRPLQEFAPIHLELAQAFFAYGDFERAQEHGQIGLEIEQSLAKVSSTLSSHRQVAFYQILAELALATADPGLALTYVEQAELAFNSVEVLDNRRAPLWFVQAQAWMLLDASPIGQSLAIERARQAWQAYQTWDLGGNQASARVWQWLRQHDRSRS